MPPRASAPTSETPAPVSERLDRVTALVLYRKLLLARMAEEAIRREYAKNGMKTPVHLGVGQEAIAIGVCHALPPGSKTFGTYRNHPLYLAVTGETDRFFAELYGKMTGGAKGKAGSMHLAAPEQGVLATSAIVGTTIPLAVGAALANAYRHTDDVTAVFFGDGAVEEGVFWESLNFACLRRLNVLFVCEDNGLAIHTPAGERQGFRTIPDAVRGFACEILTGDGADLTAVIRITQQALHRMAEQSGPAFLHFPYFRFLEHVGVHEDFDAGYRPRPSPEELAPRDPVARFERGLTTDGVAPEELAAVRAAVAAQIAASIRAAEEAPFPPAEELMTDVFV